jgi:hypothetical protein
MSLKEEGMKWGTVRNYVTLYGHFLRYLNTVREWRSTWYTEVTRKCLMAAYKGLMKTCGKQAKREMQIRKIQIRDLLIDVKYIKAYLKSPALRRALKRAYCTVASATELQKSLKIVRNNVILILQLTNAKRAGIFSDITVEHVENGQELVQKDGSKCYAMTVEIHKTLKAMGGSTVTTLPKIYDSIKAYLRNIRAHIVNYEHGYLFVNGMGNPVDPTDINKYLGEAWTSWLEEDSVACAPPHINCSLVRRSIVTVSRKIRLSRDDQQTMARAMDQSWETAEKIYSSHHDVECSQDFAEILFNQILQLPEDEVEQDDSDEEVIEEVQDLEAVEDIGPAKGQLMPNEKRLWFGKEAVFNEEETFAIREACSLYIQDKIDDTTATLYAPEIRLAIQRAGPSLRQLRAKFPMQQILDKVRAMVRSGRKKNKRKMQLPISSSSK